MTLMTDKSPPRTRVRTRSKYTRTRIVRTPEQYKRHIRHLEAEYDQPISDIIAGYYRDGESERSTARILGIPRHHLRHCTNATPPARPRTLREKSRLHRAHIRATLRRRQGRRITHHGTTRCISEWSELTGIERTVIHKRLARGWTVHRTLTERTR